MNEPDAPETETEPVKSEITMDYILARKKVRAARPSQSDICDALPEENAVEVTDERTGKKRIDYKGVKIKNADGTLNKYGKNLIDMHAEHHRVGVEVEEKKRHGDYAEKAQHTADIERKWPLDPVIAERVAKARKLMRVHAPPGKRTFRFLNICDVNGIPNLWFDENGRLVRMAMVGTRESQRVEVYSA